MKQIPSQLPLFIFSLIIAFTWNFSEANADSSGALYVRPLKTGGYGDTGNNNGKGYNNAFNGLGDIDWSLLSGGKTLYVVGHHWETLVVEAEGASESNRLMIRGDSSHGKGWIRGADSVIDNAWILHSNNNIYRLDWTENTPTQLYLDNKIGEYEEAFGLLDKKGEWTYDVSGEIYLHTGEGQPNTAFSKIAVGMRRQGIIVEDMNYVLIHKMNVVNISEGPEVIGVYSTANKDRGAIVLRNSVGSRILHCEIRNSAYSIRSSEGSTNASIMSNTIKGMVRRDKGDNDFFAAAILSDGNNALIYGNTILGVVPYYEKSRIFRFSDGIDVTCIKFPDYYSKNTKVGKNIINSIGKTGILIQNRSNQTLKEAVNISVYENRIDDSFLRKGDTDGIACGDSGLNRTSVFTGVNIHRNYIEDFAGAGIHIANNWGEGVKIYFNVVKKCTKVFPSMGAIKGQNGTRIFNNTIYEVPKRHGIKITVPGDHIGVPLACDVRNNIIQTNLNSEKDWRLAYGIYVETLEGGITPTITGGNNSIYGISAAVTSKRRVFGPDEAFEDGDKAAFVNSGVYAPPRIKDPVNDDWELKSSTPLSEKGLWAYGETRDHKGLATINTSAPPIGSMEKE